MGSGILFAAGWYMFFGAIIEAHVNCLVWGGSWSQRHVVNCTDANNSHPHHGDIAPDALVSGAYWGPGILSTFGLIGLNMISWEAVVEEGSFGEGAVVCARIWTMASLVLLFGGLGFAIWCFVTDFQTANAWHSGGVMVLIQNLLILLSAFVFRFVRRSGDHSI